jgi:hypothetical protein
MLPDVWEFQSRKDGAMIELPCMRDRCIGNDCGNFNDPQSKFFNENLKPGCKGGEFPPWSWSKWYIEKFGKENENGQV